MSNEERLKNVAMEYGATTILSVWLITLFMGLTRANPVADKSETMDFAFDWIENRLKTMADEVDNLL